jgi:hypothetical protein
VARLGGDQSAKWKKPANGYYLVNWVMNWVLMRDMNNCTQQLAECGIDLKTVAAGLANNAVDEPTRLGNVLLAGESRFYLLPFRHAGNGLGGGYFLS